MILRGIPISNEQCIGDSLSIINNAFLSLSAEASRLSVNKINKPVSTPNPYDILTYSPFTLTWVASAGNNFNQTTARAWVCFRTTAAGTSIITHFNVSSVVANGTGDYTINLIRPMNQTECAIVASGARGGTPGGVSNGIEALALSPSSFKVVWYPGTLAVNSTINAVVFAN